ncbi:MAG: riboflavin synthase [Bacillota bacterium]
MFTGLIEEIGTIKSIVKTADSARINISADKVLQDVRLGDSISTNGVCLTVTKFDKSSFWVDVMPETMRRSNLKNLQSGSRVNLERALRFGDRLGGHIVSGHIDGIGIVSSLKEEDNATWVSVEASEEILRYIVHKGSVAIDGTSLTVAYVEDKMFKVSIIPLTRDKTTLLEKKVGDEVNLECDMIGKYVEKLMSFSQNGKKARTIDMDFLRENGFM